MFRSIYSDMENRICCVKGTELCFLQFLANAAVVED